MRGRGYTTVKGRQVHISVYLPVRQYSSLRAATKKTGLSIQQLIRRSLDQVLEEIEQASRNERRDPMMQPAAGSKARAAGEGVAARLAHGRVLIGSLAAVRSSRELLRKARKT